MIDRGIIYLLEGQRHARLFIVSVWSLRQHYSGPVTLFASDDQAESIAATIASDSRLNLNVIRIRPAISNGRNRSNVIKTCLYQYCPYEVAAFLDCDTVVQNSIDDLFEIRPPEAILVTRFSDWVVGKRAVARRVRSWKTTAVNLFANVNWHGPAINTGVFGFSRQTAVLHEWHRLTLIGRRHFIPDEIAMQMLITCYPHKIISSRFNFSTKCDRGDVREANILHFHGRSHLGRHGDIWRSLWLQVVHEGVGHISKWCSIVEPH